MTSIKLNDFLPTHT